MHIKRKSPRRCLARQRPPPACRYERRETKLPLKGRTRLLFSDGASAASVLPPLPAFVALSRAQRKYSACSKKKTPEATLQAAALISL